MNKYIDNLVSLKTEKMMSPRPSTCKAIAQVMNQVRESRRLVLVRVIMQARNDGSNGVVRCATGRLSDDEISPFIETHKRKLKSVIPRIRTVYENQGVPERNPVAQHAHYEKCFIANSLSTGFRSS
jgi:hypothetical protein